MKTTLLPLIFAFLLLGLQFHSMSQNQPSKFGKIDLTELESKLCPIDSNAHAYYIFDVGNTSFEYDQTMDKGFQLVFNRHLRIKILDKQAFDWGNFSIPIYQSNFDKEEVTSLKAFTYNLEEGKITKIKLEKSDILTEETSDNWRTLKFAMPGLKEGSVLEIEYDIRSDYLFNLQEWYFQRKIPILYSDYTVKIPEYFNYNRSSTGYYPIQSETGCNFRKLTLTHRQQAEGLTVKEEKYTYDVDFTENIFHYSASNIPAFPEEKFMKTAENYLSKIEFELQSTQFPNQIQKYYTASWEEIDNKLNESANFGLELKRANHLDDDTKLLKDRNLGDEPLMNAALRLIHKKISWNGQYNKYTSATLGRAYKTGEGNSADVNLNLVMLLRSLGFTSHPLILSTQAHGIIHPAHPSITRFNYVIAMVAHNGKTYLLDATDPNSSANLVPIRCLNDKGRVIGDLPDKWINLMDYKSYVSKSQCMITLDSTLSVNGKIRKYLSDYSAYFYKSKLKESAEPEESIKELEEESTSYTINNLQISTSDSIVNQMELSYDISSIDGLNNAADMVYFSPALDPFFNENPFKLEKREFPVEFNYPYQVQRMYAFVLPENYEISELPQPLMIKLPEGAGSFRYDTKKIGNMISISSMIDINKSLFLPDEYELLKTFVQIIVDKEKEMIVLKSRN
ncbi:DUF3857 domain-containing protein [Gaoshiqia sediminis]|uniref:DUF3857 domain-containing protein n=1 Tax=Gaoshiqia sediminis TaxID=2986998 RepID=A0AA41Y8G7_9BACT|nr:DUF3857 domain-containing protein [Gaoshiqia sediminis]MCW0481120.1 DUF3857 domain-containing protein [Gaoshiqia sediminis]